MLAVGVREGFSLGKLLAVGVRDGFSSENWISLTGLAAFYKVLNYDSFD